MEPIHPAETPSHDCAATSIFPLDDFQVGDRPTDDRPEVGLGLGEGAGDDETTDVARLADALFLEVGNDLDQLGDGLGIGECQAGKDGISVEEPVLVLG